MPPRISYKNNFDHDTLIETNAAVKNIEKDIEDIKKDLKLISNSLSLMTINVAVLEQEKVERKTNLDKKDSNTRNLIAILSIISATISSLVAIIIHVLFTKVP